LLLFALLAKLKETQSEKISTILKLRLNFRLKGENEEKTPNSLLFESIRCPLTVFFWHSVSVLIKKKACYMNWGDCS